MRAIRSRRLAVGALLVLALSAWVPANLLRAPDPPSLKAVAGDGTATLSWEPVTGAKGYLLYSNIRDNALDPALALDRYLGSEGPFTYHFLSNTIGYRFAIAAVNQEGVGEKSPEVAVTPTASPAPFSWLDMRGNMMGEDQTNALVVDSSGNLYAAGTISEIDFSGKTLERLKNAFVAKYSSSGSLAWVNYHSTTDVDRGLALDVDSSGNAFLAGASGFIPNCQGGGGSYDVLVAKFDSSGNKTWSTTIGNKTEDFAYEIVSDGSGGAYLGGWAGNLDGTLTEPGFSSSAFVAKVGSDGTLAWVKNHVKMRDVEGLARDASGNLIVGGSAGYTNLPHTPYLAKLDSSGSQTWFQAFTSEEKGDYGTVEELVLAADGSIVAVGSTYRGYGQTHGGLSDAFVAKYDASGTQQWIRLLGGVQAQGAYDVEVDSAGAIHLVGITFDDMGTGTHFGGWDIFYARYDSSGNLQKLKIIGTPGKDVGISIAVAADKTVYLGGYSTGDLGGPSQSISVSGSGTYVHYFSQNLFVARLAE